MTPIWKDARSKESGSEKDLEFKPSGDEEMNSLVGFFLRK
jgi:hypothetical protein